MDAPRSQFPDLKNDYMLTFNCDLDTFPHFSTSSDVKAYQMDLRSSDFKSILLFFLFVRKRTTFPCALRRLLRSEWWAVVVRIARETPGQSTDRCANCKGSKGVRCRADLKRRRVKIKVYFSSKTHFWRLLYILHNIIWIIFLPSSPNNIKMVKLTWQN